VAGTDPGATEAGVMVTFAGAGPTAVGRAATVGTLVVGTTAGLEELAATAVGAV
jgi:hypothetical protein